MLTYINFDHYLFSKLCGDHSREFCWMVLLSFVGGVVNFGLECGCAESLSISWYLVVIVMLE